MTPILYRLVKRKKLDTANPDGVLRITEESLDRLIEEGRVK